jgi:hypothetical protein
LASGGRRVIALGLYSAWQACRGQQHNQGDKTKSPHLAMIQEQKNKTHP